MPSGFMTPQSNLPMAQPFRAPSTGAAGFVGGNTAQAQPASGALGSATAVPQSSRPPVQTATGADPQYGSTLQIAGAQPNPWAAFSNSPYMQQGADLLKKYTGQDPRASSPSVPTPPPGYTNGGTATVTPSPQQLQDPGNNMMNPGYDEQALQLTQNRLLEDPYAEFMRSLSGQAAQPTQGEDYLNNNLGNLEGPGQGTQYWQGMQGQYMNPFAGEQFTREATQNFSPTGPAGAFFDQAMGQYGDFTGYSGPQNAQGQYGQSQGQIGNGTIGQNNMAQIAGGYGDIGRYGDPNLAAGQYAQTQGAFGDLPIANFDPFFDRASQLGVQNYNKQAAGRGVYGSSEALSGVGNVVTDIEAQRALKGFDAEMQREQALQGRQKLLGEQARMGDLSSLSAFGANLSGVETFGNLNNQMGQLQNQSQDILGNMANNADSQAARAQEANISGLNAFGSLASNADTAATNRYNATTGAMDAADRTQLARQNAGADVAFRSDDAERADYEAEGRAATNAANATTNRQQTAANIANQGSSQDLARLNSYNQTASGAESSRQGRQTARMNDMQQTTQMYVNAIGGAQAAALAGDDAAFDEYFDTQVKADLQRKGLSDAEIAEQKQMLHDGVQAIVTGTDRATED